MQKSDTDSWGAQGERLRQARALLKMKAADFASAMNLSRGYLSELENGKRSFSTKVLDSLARAGVNPEFVSAGQGEPLSVNNRTFAGSKFFAAEGKQVSESAAGGAFAGPRRGPNYVLDPDRHALLTQVITAVLDRLDDQGLSLEPAKTAELILLIYDDIADAGPDAIDEDHVTKKAGRLMRLVG